MVELLEGGTTHTTKEDSDDPDIDKIHSHLAQIDNPDELISSDATLQDLIAAHVPVANLPKSRFTDKFYGVLIDTGCAR